MGGLGGSSIRGLSITRFDGAGILLGALASVVEGNYLGLAPDGTAAGNGSGTSGDAGIEVRSTGNRIGGTAPTARNVLSGNNGHGIYVVQGVDNVVIGNRIGTNADGTSAVPNTAGGVLLENIGPQTVGGGEPGAGNLISGNGGDGIFVSGTGADGSVIQGNTIGLTAAGTTALPNGTAGIAVNETDSLRIGGPLAGQGNVISGNGAVGIGLVGSSNTRIQGNLIGLSAAGDVSIPNLSGMILENSDAIQVGGTTAGARNVISGGPSGYGVIVGAGTSDISIQGNYIGTDASGETGIGSSTGIIVGSGAQSTTIGGVVPGAGNVISGHSARGVQIDLAGPGNRVLGNSIGTDKDETDVIPNDIGIELDGMTGVNVSDNVVAGSDDVGILVFVGSDSNTFAGNFVGTNRSDTLDLGNGDGMRFVNGGGNNNVVGPNNVFAHNVEQGIELDVGTGNRISANSFHDNGAEAIFLAVGANNDQAAPTITSATKTGSMTSDRRDAVEHARRRPTSSSTS